MDKNALKLSFYPLLSFAFADLPFKRLSHVFVLPVKYITALRLSALFPFFWYIRLFLKLVTLLQQTCKQKVIRLSHTCKRDALSLHSVKV